MFSATVVRSCRRCASASSTMRRGDPFRRRDEHELVGALDREPGERAGDAGAEIEQHDLVEGGEERDELAVAVGAEPGRQLGVARRAEDVQAGRQPATRTGPSSAAVLSRSASSSRSASERSDRRASGASRASVPKSGLASTAIARSLRWLASRLPSDERAERLADAALRADQRDRVRSRHAGLRADPRSTSASSRSPLGDEQPLHPAGAAARPRRSDAGRPSTSGAG